MTVIAGTARQRDEFGQTLADDKGVPAFLAVSERDVGTHGLHAASSGAAASPAASAAGEPGVGSGRGTSEGQARSVGQRSESFRIIRSAVFRVIRPSAARMKKWPCPMSMRPKVDINMPRCAAKSSPSLMISAEVDIPPLYGEIATLQIKNGKPATLVGNMPRCEGCPNVADVPPCHYSKKPLLLSWPAENNLQFKRQWPAA